MGKRNIILLILVLSCVPPTPEPFVPPPVKSPTAETGSSPLEQGLLTEYDIWEFLKENPTEQEVLTILGLPDSIWVSDEQPYYVLYFYRPQLKDYNSVELNMKDRKVTGYEWDE